MRYFVKLRNSSVAFTSYVWEDVRTFFRDMYKIVWHHCKHEDDWILSGWQKTFYTFKALICYLLGRWQNNNDNDGDWYPERILVTYLSDGIYWTEWGTSYWYEGIFVGMGYFRNWWIEDGSDSSS